MIPNNYIPFDYIRFIFVFPYLILVGFLISRFLIDSESKRFCWFLFFGVLIYGGVGSVFITTDYVIFFIVYAYILVLISVFIITQRILDKYGTSFLFDENYIILKKNHWQFIAIVLIFFYLIPLIYPQFKLHLLIFPPAPNISDAVDAKFSSGSGGGVIFVLIRYIEILSFPVFLFVITFFRRIWWLGIAFFIFPYYINYVESAYIPRNQIAQVLIVVFFVMWIRKDVNKKLLRLFALAIMPIIIIFFVAYVNLRQGDENVGIFHSAAGVTEGVLALLYMETSLVSMINFLTWSNSGGHILDFFTWIVSLPIPSFLFDYTGVRFNVAYTEVLTGRFFDETTGNTTRRILLPTLPGEGLFLFGPALFWLHAMTIGLVTSATCFYTKRDPKLIFIHCYFLADCMLMARSGSSGTLPAIFNYSLLMWIFGFAFATRTTVGKVPAVVSQFYSGRKKNYTP